MSDQNSVPEPQESTEQDTLEPVTQSWSGYSWYLVKRLGRGTLGVINYLGEKLAYGLGITTPDWQYAIDIHENMEREEREEREAEEKALRAQREAALKMIKEMEENARQPGLDSNKQLSTSRTSQ